MAGSKQVGVVTHYYDRLGVAIVKLASALRVGDTVKFEGHNTNFEQTIGEMQFDHQPIQAGKKGQEVGIKVSEKVREHDRALAG